MQCTILRPAHDQNWVMSTMSAKLGVNTHSVYSEYEIFSPMYVAILSLPSQVTSHFWGPISHPQFLLPSLITKVPPPNLDLQSCLLPFPRLTYATDHMINSKLPHGFSNSLHGCCYIVSSLLQSLVRI